MTDLNATAVSVLGFLHRGPLTGWEVARTVTETIGDFWNVTRSQVYRELRTLETAGLVTAGETGPRDRRPYTLTDAGRRAFSRAIDREPGDDVIRSPLLLAVFFGAHADPERLRRHLTVHRLRHEDRLRTYRELMAAVAGTGEETRFDRAALAYGIEHEQSVLRWFDRLPTLLGDGVVPSAP